MIKKQAWLVVALVLAGCARTTGSGQPLSIVVTSEPTADPSQPPRCQPLLVNGGFEAPDAVSWALFDMNEVPGWKTTASFDRVEVWETGFANVPSFEGQQLAEGNSTGPGVMFQDVNTTQGLVLMWRLAHRGRSGADEMTLSIGQPDVPELAQSFRTGQQEWVVYSGEYVVPPGQTITRFALETISTSDGSRTEGNFVDGVYFGTPCDFG